jgi:hypothetical protein
MIRSNEEQVIVIVSIVRIQALSYHTWSEYDRLATCCGSSHLIDQVEIMLTWNIGNINRSATDAARSSMEARVVVDCLKHVPIGYYVQMLSKQSVVCIDPDVPRMAGGDLGKEIVGVANENRRTILWHLRVEENLRSLRHARNRFYAEVSKCRYGPGIKVGSNKFSSVFCKLEGIQHELCTVSRSANLRTE